MKRGLSLTSKEIYSANLEMPSTHELLLLAGLLVCVIYSRPAAVVPFKIHSLMLLMNSLC